MALIRSLNIWKLEPVDWAIEKQTSLTDLDMGTSVSGSRPVFFSSDMGTSCVGQLTWPVFISSVMLGGVSLLFSSLHTVYNGFFFFFFAFFVFKVVSASFNTDWVKREVGLLVLRFVVNTLSIYYYNTGKALVPVSPCVCRLLSGYRVKWRPSHMV